MSELDRILMLWAAGKNTAEIGKALKIDEPRVVEAIHAWRESYRNAALRERRRRA